MVYRLYSYLETVAAHTGVGNESVPIFPFSPIGEVAAHTGVGNESDNSSRRS